MDECGIPLISFVGITIILIILAGLEVISGMFMGIGIIVGAIVLGVLECTLTPYLDWRKIDVSSLGELLRAKRDTGKLPSMKEVRKREKGEKH